MNNTQENTTFGSESFLNIDSKYTNSTESNLESMALHIVRLTIYPLFCFVGLTGNGFICYLAIRGKRWNSSSGMLLLNLAISDLLVVTVFLPFDLVYVELAKWVWPYGPLMCKIVNTLTDLSVIVSGTTILFVSFDRCRHIINPMKEPLSKVKKITILLLIWFYAILLLLPFTMALRIFPNGECLTDTNFWPSLQRLQISYVCLIFMPEFGIPMIGIFINYIRICTYLKKYQSQLSRGTSGMEGFQGILAYRTKQNAKTLKILTGLVIVFTICVLPHQIVLLLVVFNNSYLESTVIRQIHEFTRLLLTSNSCLNPILYGGLSKKFKKYVVQLFCRRSSRQRRAVQDSMTKTSRSRASSFISTRVRYTSTPSSFPL